MALENIKVSHTMKDGSEVHVQASGRIAELLRARIDSGRLHAVPISKPITGHDTLVVHNDEDLLVIDLGLNNLIAISKDALRNVLRDFSISSHDFVIRPIDLIKTKNMRIMSVLGIDVLVSPMTLLELSSLPVSGKASLTPALYPFDQDGTITFDTVTARQVMFRNDTRPGVEGGKFFAVAGKVTPYNTLSGLTTVTFTMGQFRFDLKLDGSVGSFVFGIPRQVYNMSRVCTTMIENGKIVTEVRGSKTSFDRVYEFNPASLLKEADSNTMSVVIEGVNANVQLYPITIDETIKTAALTAFASGRPDKILESALNDI